MSKPSHRVTCLGTCLVEGRAVVGNPLQPDPKVTPLNLFAQNVEMLQWQRKKARKLQGLWRCQHLVTPLTAHPHLPFFLLSTFLWPDNRLVHGQPCVSVGKFYGTKCGSLGVVSMFPREPVPQTRRTVGLNLGLAPAHPYLWTTSSLSHAFNHLQQPTLFTVHEDISCAS